MSHDVIDDLLERIRYEEAYRHTRCIGSQPQNVELWILVAQFGHHGVKVEHLGALYFLCRRSQRTFRSLSPSLVDLILLQIYWINDASEGRLVGTVVTFGPINHSGVAEMDLLVGIGVGEQVVQRRCVSEGGIFADRRVLTLRTIIGFISRSVEANECRPARLCATHALELGCRRATGATLPVTRHCIFSASCSAR